MDYLTSTLTASAPAIVLICRQLATLDKTVTESALRTTLQPAALRPDDQPDRGGSGGVLASSLSVAEDIGLVESDGGKDPRWRLTIPWPRHPKADSAELGPELGIVAARMGARAVAVAEAKGAPADVPVKLVWLLSRDPLRPLSTAFNGETEKAFREAGDSSVNGDRWNALRRWARGLGLAAEVPVEKARPYLLMDPTRLIRITLPSLPQQATAKAWLNQLRETQPLLGHRALTRDTDEFRSVTGALALALRKLEQLGEIRLLQSHDSREAVPLRLGGRSLQLGEIHVTKGQA